VPAKKACQTVTKTVHGQKKRAQVCKTVKSKPAATPRPALRLGQAGFLYSTAVDTRGTVFVVARQIGDVLKVSPSGQILAAWNVPTDPKTFEAPDPNGIALDAQGNVYVSDAHNYRIVKLSPQGKVLAVWDTAYKAGRAAFGPSGVAVDAPGYVYTTNFDYSEVEKYSPSGQLAMSFGKECPQQQGEGPLPCANAGDIPPGELNHPAGLALDAQGNIYVNDHRSRRVVKFSPTGQQLAAFGPKLADPYGSLGLMEGIAVDAQGDVLVDDESVQRVLELSPEGQPLAQWLPGSDYSPVGDPGIDAQGNIYITVSADDGRPSYVAKLSPSLRLLAEWK
jgi:DNA-binding beta-propeller fold protein YncE